MAHEEAIRHLIAADEILARVIRKVGDCMLVPDHNPRRQPRGPFESLVEAVAHQQLNGIAARTILGRLKALFPKKSFPRPEELLAIPGEQLRKAGFSRAKIIAIKDICAKTVEEIVPSARTIVAMENEEIISRLTTIRGVG